MKCQHRKRSIILCRYLRDCIVKENSVPLLENSVPLQGFTTCNIQQPSSLPCQTQDALYLPSQGNCLLSHRTVPRKCWEDGLKANCFICSCPYQPVVLGLEELLTPSWDLGVFQILVHKTRMVSAFLIQHLTLMPSPNQDTMKSKTITQYARKMG